LEDHIYHFFDYFRLLVIDKKLLLIRMKFDMLYEIKNHRRVNARELKNSIGHFCYIDWNEPGPAHYSLTMIIFVKKMDFIPSHEYLR